jgi:hypothetical protein
MPLQTTVYIPTVIRPATVFKITDIAGSPAQPFAVAGTHRAVLVRVAAASYGTQRRSRPGGRGQGAATELAGAPRIHLAEVKRTCVPAANGP